MKTINYSYLKRFDGHLSAANIMLSITENTAQSHRVITETTQETFRSQGLGEAGYEHWNLSAERAIEVVLETIEQQAYFDVHIHKLEGRLFIETNNAAIGIACILAIWEFFGVEVSDEKMRQLHEFVKDDWKKDCEEIPNFSELLAMI